MHHKRKKPKRRATRTEYGTKGRHNKKRNCVILAEPIITFEQFCSDMGLIK